MCGDAAGGLGRQRLSTYGITMNIYAIMRGSNVLAQSMSVAAQVIPVEVNEHCEGPLEVHVSEVFRNRA